MAGPGAGYHLDRVPGEDRSVAVTDLRWLQRSEPAIERSGEVCSQQLRGRCRGPEGRMIEGLLEAREGSEALGCEQQGH